MTMPPDPGQFGPNPDCTCGASAFNHDPSQRGIMAHAPACRAVLESGGCQTGASALRMLEEQCADPAELRELAYQRQRARYGGSPADALAWLAAHKSVNVAGER